jgi:crotonobetainyl-CoA:carnitine CoA-transferase CaiB-like acyl-CoA transferase
MAPYESFRTADREIVVAVTNDKSWASLCRLAEFQKLANDPRFAEPALRNNNRAVLVPAFEAILRTRPAAHWLAMFDAAGIPAEPINTLPEILDHPQVADRDMLIEVEYPPGSGNGIRTAGMPWRQVAAERPVLSPPGLGQHTEEVLSALSRRTPT